MLNTRVVVTLASLFSIACAAPEIEYPLHMRLADNAPAEMKQGTREAAETWNALSREKLGHDIIIISDTEYEHSSASAARKNRKNDIFATSMDEYTTVQDQNWLGICTHQQRPHGIYVDISFAPERRVFSWVQNGDMLSAYYFIALHEFGHAVGLVHVDNVSELMHGVGRDFVDVPSEITPEAVTAFCEIHGCE